MKKSFLKNCGIAIFLAVTLVFFVISINTESSAGTKKAATIQQSESPGCSVSILNENFSATNGTFAYQSPMQAVQKSENGVAVSDVVQIQTTFNTTGEMMNDTGQKEVKLASVSESIMKSEVAITMNVMQNEGGLVVTDVGQVTAQTSNTDSTNGTNEEGGDLCQILKCPVMVVSLNLG